MDQYQMIGAVIVALGGLASIVVPIVKLNTSIVELTVEMRNVRKSDDIRDKRLETHGNEIDGISDQVHNHTHILGNHETRIKCLEERNRK